VLEETSDAGFVLARHMTANGSYYGPWLHMWRSGGVSRFPLFDAVGTARGLVDASATITDSYVLDSFGTPTGAATTTVNPYRYGGAWGYITDPSGLQQLGARFYWPELGRFIQQDPVGDGMNWYAYAGNNPVVYVDAEGESYLDIGGQVPLWPFLLEAGIGPMGGIIFGTDPCAPQPVGWWDAPGIFHKYVHPYVGAGVGTIGGGVSIGPDSPYPQYAASPGLYAQGSGAVGLGAAVGVPLDKDEGRFWEVVIGAGVWGGVYYLW